MNKFLRNGSVYFAADTGAEGGATEDTDVLPDDGVEIDAPIEEETEYLEEGSEEARKLVNPDEKSREDVLAELKQAREELAAVKDASNPVSALQQSMDKFMSHVAPPKPARKDGSTAGINAQVARMSDEDFQKRFNQKILEDPYTAQMELQSRTMEPVLQTFAVNQAQVSRELLLANPKNKEFYDKYSDEIEDAVAAVPVVERIKNPKIYQTALSQVKAAHSDEITAETVSAQVAELVAKQLEAYGIKPGEMPPKKQQGTFVTPTSVSSRPTTTAKTTRQIVIPKWVAQEARQKGLDAGFLFEHYKETGKVK